MTPRPFYTEASQVTVADDARQLLEQYSEIPADQVLPHVLHIRDKGYAIFPYACLGQVRFLRSTLPSLPDAVALVARAQAGATVMDLGCCFGQELRYLHFVHGIPARQLYGLDSEPRYFDLAFELFRDRARASFREATFVTADLLAAPGSEGLRGVEGVAGQMDVIIASSLLHLWGYEEQVAAATQMVRLSRPRAGSLMVGLQMGSRNPGVHEMPSFGLHYRHNEASLAELWAKVGRATGTEWEVWSECFDAPAVTMNKELQERDPGACMLRFTCTRL